MKWVLIDSFREDYLRYCPFLYEFSKDYTSKLEPVVGYQQYLASYFSGMYPDKINVWTWFAYSPETSIFNWTSRFSNVDALDITILKYWIEFVSYLKSKTSDMSKSIMPLKIMKYFDLGLKTQIIHKNSLIFPTIFDKMRENNMKFKYIKGSIVIEDKEDFSNNLVHVILRSDERTINLAKKRDSYSLLFLYLTQLDGITHINGPHSKHVREHVQKIDTLLEDFLKKEKEPIIIHSDHGMTEVTTTVDINKRIEALGYENGKDYLMFLDSALARFWFFNEKAKYEIIESLKELNKGKIISNKEEQNFGISFKDNRFGELFFILNHGNVILPNYFQSSKPKAMHGYIPDKNEYGVFLTNLDGLDKRNVKFIDIYPTILDYYKIKYVCQGKSLFSKV